MELHHRRSGVPGEDFGLDPTGNRRPLKALSRLVLGLLSSNKLGTHAKPLSFKQGLKVPLCQNSFFFTQKSSAIIRKRRTPRKRVPQEDTCICMSRTKFQRAKAPNARVLFALF